jgi:predicted PolB exonuclease-like 3'-5' exonuclease
MPNFALLQPEYAGLGAGLQSAAVVPPETPSMDETSSSVKYLIFDCEAVADGELISRIKYPDAELTAGEAIQRFRSETAADRPDGKDILPVTYMLPVSVAVAKVDGRGKLLDLVTLDAPLYRPHVITRLFWQGWQHYKRPTLVTFNGRGYDLPLLELAAFRYGYSVPAWFNTEEKSYDQSRNRYNTFAHLDLSDMISNFGATRLAGGLNLLANLIGKPGKTGIDGSKVQDMYHAGHVQEINDYCRCDVLDTYFVFLRSRVLMGKLRLEEEQALVDEAHRWLQERAEMVPAYRHYLTHWGEWHPPQD